MIRSRFSCSGRWEALTSPCWAEGLHFTSWDVYCHPLCPAWMRLPAWVSLPSPGLSVAHAAISQKLTLIPQNRLSFFWPISGTWFLRVNPPFLYQQTLVFRKKNVCLLPDSSDLCLFKSYLPCLFPNNRDTFSCGDCSRVVTSPLLRRHLQVFLDCPSRPQCTVKVKVGAV